MGCLTIFFFILILCNSSFRNEKSSVKHAYMGHLIELENHIVEQCKKNESFNDFLKTKLPEETFNQWETFVAEQLSEINKIQRIMLVSLKKIYCSLQFFFIF